MKVSEALAALCRIAPGSILAGGYLRDMTFGKPVKDVDFFVSYGTTCETLSTVFPDARREIYAEFLYYSSSEVIDVISIGTVGGYPAQVIVLKPYLDPMDRVAHMDFGFCQIACGIQGGDLTAAFHKDKRNNTATLVYCESKQEFDRSMKRWDRLKLKYPERTLVIPEEYQQWQHQA